MQQSFIYFREMNPNGIISGIFPDLRKLPLDNSQLFSQA